MTDYISNMAIDAVGRFWSPANREIEFLRYPFSLTSRVSGEVKNIECRGDLMAFLIRHKDAGATSMSINEVLGWVDDQSLPKVNPPTHNFSADPGWIYYC